MFVLGDVAVFVVAAEDAAQGVGDVMGGAVVAVAAIAFEVEGGLSQKEE